MNIKQEDVPVTVVDLQENPQYNFFDNTLSDAPSISYQNTDEIDVKPVDLTQLILQRAQPLQKPRLTPLKLTFPTLSLEFLDGKQSAYNSWRLHCLQRLIYFKTYEIAENEIRKNLLLMNITPDTFLVIKKCFEDGQEIGYDEFHE